MACLKGVAVPLNWTMILAAALSLLVPSASAQKCPSVFSSTVDIGGFDETVELVFTMDETTPSGTELYELSWDDDCVAPPDITDENFNKYFFVNDTVDCAWIVSVNEDLIGLPDYPGLQNLFTITVTFDGFTTIDYSQCDVTLTHVLKDANTQKPKPSQAAYAVNIKEDFSPHYTIPGFNTPVHDMDATSPNNEFSVSVDSNCPLESTQSTYTSGQNLQAVEYLLKEAVNYEKGDTIVCTVTFEDKGTTPLSDSTTITITVQDVNDEPPIFTHDYYYSVVSSVLNPGNALDISPSEISASDGDTGINDTITYSMKDANPDVNGLDYFSIKENTGEVVMLETLDNDFLLNERVLFFVQASDGSLTSPAILEVTLPPAPTTTSTTTTTTTTTATTTTCEPCTCPTYTTEFATECPTTPTQESCPPCTTTELVCPTTPSEGTCTPCPTETTTECNCPERTCPTTQTEGTCTPCPTQTTTECSCPETTCPTTTTEGTCTPCPTETTTECNCPETTCPTTQTEGTCTPCPTETTTECNCPETTCPTTPSEGTCTPCPTETTTDCNCPEITCPTAPTEGPTTTSDTGPTVTWDPALPPLTFEKESYVADIYPSFTTVMHVQVEDVEGYEVTYSLRGTGSQYFSIDASTGQISVNQDNPPPINLHKMEAVATITTSPSETATTKVTINVISQTFDKVAILSSIIKATVEEDAGEQELASVALSDTASKVCVIGADPSDMRDRFTVEKKTGTEWKLKTTGALDYEATREVTVYLQAYTDEAPEDCSSVNTEIPDVFMKSQALAIITVTNTNDEAPQFSSDSLVAAHPTNEGLKRVAGPVVSVEAKDPDSSVVTYSLEGEDAAGFTVDDATGEVYGVEGLTCDPECKFNVKASDGSYEDQVAVKVLPLDTDHVFTILMSDTDLSDVDEKLNDLTTKTGAQISMLYVSPTESTARRGGMRYRRETTMDLEVHVYSIKDGKLMSRDELNSALTDSSSGVQAEEFIDADVFEAVTQEDTTGLKVAVGVLGALLGIVLIAGVAFFVYQKKRGKPAPKQGKPPTPISTLGQAYQNPSYTNDNSPSQVNLGSESLGHKSNGSLNGYAGASLNGYTSAEVHRHPNDESPPLHRSPLAPPTDSIPLRNRDTQQQGGLKRTSPGAPEYYGSSSPAPPPSFSSTTSPSFPIYAEIKKPKDPMPAPDKKIQEDTDEEDNLPDNKFTSVKHSPPPRRSTKYDDDDDDDQDEDTAYPGGKHAGFTDEPAEEKKSVAFKVKVETKEIEAENMGPAQKKAEATKLMEANRKKLQEEGNDDDEDDDDEDTKTLRL